MDNRKDYCKEYQKNYQKTIKKNNKSVTNTDNQKARCAKENQGKINVNLC